MPAETGYGKGSDRRDNFTRFNNGDYYMPWKVYLIENAEGIFYCGITKNVSRRIDEHNGKKAGGAKFTRRGRPWELVASVVVNDKSEALSLEHKVKKARKHNKIKTLEDYRNG